MKKKVLVIEDNPDIQKLYSRQLGEAFILLQATSMGEAIRMIEENADIDIAVVDGSVSGKPLDTMPLLATLIQRENVTVFAAAGSMDHSHKMSEICDSITPIEKENVWRRIFNPHN